MKLKNKAVVITGGTSRIGRAFALRAVKDGAKVMIAARGEERLQKVVDEIENAGGKGFFR